MPLRRLRLIADFATLLIVAAILVGTLSPPDTFLATTLGINPQLGHLVLFGALGVTSALRFAVSDRARRFPRSSLGVAFFGFWILGASTELLQGPIGRDPDLTDWVLDMVGATAGFIVGSVLLRIALRFAPVPEQAIVEPPPPRRSRRARARQ